MGAPPFTPLGGQQPPPGAQPPQYPQYGHGPGVYSPKPPNEMGTSLIAVIKGFFSSDPTQSLSPSIDSKAHIWPIFGGGHILVVALVLAILPVQVISGLVVSFAGDALGSGYMGFRITQGDIAQQIGMFFPFLSSFGVGFLLASVSFFMMAGLVKVITVVHKVSASFITVMNALSPTVLFSTLTFVAALMFSFFLAPLSLALLFVGALGSAAMLYVGIKKIGPFNTGPFWLYFAAITIHIVLLVLIMIPLYTLVVESAIRSYMTSNSWGMPSIPDIFPW